MALKIKRIYDEPSKTDGKRVLVDRLWPRGVSKQRAALDLWLKDVAPSPGLREWFGHKPERFKEFGLKYDEELSKNPAVDELRKLIADNKQVTLLYAAKDPEVNHALVLQRFLEK
jgi:uncharacterized protein YeaO (DUF488 family)